MASVGNGQAGRTLIGTGVTSSPTFASIGTLSGLTQFGVILGGGSGPFTSTNAGAAGYVLTSSGPGSAPVFSPASASGISTVQGNSGGSISPSAGNINVVGAGSTTVAGSGSTLTVQMTGLTNHSLLVGAGTATITKVGPTATAGQVLQSAGSSADPSFSTATYPAASAGSGKILYDNGTNYVTSTPTFPASASATTRKIIVSDGTNWVASTETYAVPGTSGNVLTSDGTNWISAAASGGTSYSLQCGGTIAFTSPADSTTYYVVPFMYTGTSWINAISQTTRVYIPKTGTLRAVVGSVSVAGVLGSAENVTLAIRLNDSSNTSITTTSQWTAVLNPFSNTGMSLAVTAGDFISFLIITPAWATNPTSVIYNATAFIS